MEVVSQLRIELYDELQALPQGLRSSFPDLAADFLSGAFKPRQRSKQPSSAATQHPPLVPFQLPVDALRPAGELNGASCALSDACLASMQAALANLSDEAAGAEAAATSADGWGDLALSAWSAVTPTKPHDGDRRSVPSLVSRLSMRPGPAHLLKCQLCQKVVLGCCARKHQRQCSQQPEAPAKSNVSVSEVSSGDMPNAPCVSRGRKRRHTSDSHAACAHGQSMISQTCMSKGVGSSGSSRYCSPRASPSTGDVAQKFLWPRRPPQQTGAADWGMSSAQPQSPTIRLTKQHRRQRSQQPPRVPRRYLHTHPGRDLTEPIMLNAASAPLEQATAQQPAADAVGAVSEATCLSQAAASSAG